MSSHFLLLFFLFTTTTTTTTSATSTTSPPPSPPPLTLQPQTQFNSIIDALIQTGDFNNWANFLSETLNPTILPPSFTLFAPIDDSFLTGINPSPPQTAVNFLDPLLFPYHIVPLPLSFNSLLHFPINTRLPTLLSSFSLLITNHSSINGVRIIRPNLYQTPFVSVHGVASILDYTLFGADPPTPAPEYHFRDDKKDPNTGGGLPRCSVWVRILMYVALFLLFDMASSSGGWYQIMWYMGMFALFLTSRRPESSWDRRFLFVWLLSLSIMFLLSAN